MNAPCIVLRDVTKTFRTPAGDFAALSGISLTIDRGEFVAVVGQSGSGKSTLLGLLAGIDRPTHGTVRVGDTDVHTLSEAALSRWRGRAVGIVFQFFQLLPTLTAAENVLLPDGLVRHLARARTLGARAALARTLRRRGPGAQATATLSVGSSNVSRSPAPWPTNRLCSSPTEPTGNLDSRTAAEMLDLLAGLGEAGRTVVLVTHDASARSRASRTIHLADGRIAAAHA
jgi:putative ABC transport system ATP-binding protein